MPKTPTVQLAFKICALMCKKITYSRLKMVYFIKLIMVSSYFGGNKIIIKTLIIGCHMHQ